MLGSVTKTFLALAMLSEWQEGQLELDQDINELLPFVVDNPQLDTERIEVRHIATHTSGIRDNYEIYEAIYVDGDPQIELLEWMESYLVEGGERYDAEENFLPVEPGTQFDYTNIGACVGALIVEATSGLTYRELLRERFFEPLAMNHTAFMMANFAEDIVAVPYAEAPPERHRLNHYGYATYPDGQLRSSAVDLSHYLTMLINNGKFAGETLLTPESMQALENEYFPGLADNGESQRLYWAADPEDGTLHHTGGDNGVCTRIWFHPEQDIGGLVLLNADPWVCHELLNGATAAAKKALRELSQASTKSEPKATEADPDQLHRQVKGLFESSNCHALAAGVLRQGELTWTGYFGEAAPGRAVDESSMFNTASIAKAISAETVLRLVQQGTLDLDEPLTDHWVDPDVSKDSRHQLLTPRLVLTHRTGFANWRSHTDGVLTFEFTPGDQFHYSGEGFQYLRRAVESKTGQRFEDLVNELVLEPLEMQHSSLVQRDWMSDLVRAPSFR